MVFLSLLLTFLLSLTTAIQTASAEDAMWIGALACPFTTVTDEISADRFYSLLKGNVEDEGEIRKIYLSEDAAGYLDTLMLEQDPVVIADDKIGEYITKGDEGTYCAVIPIDAMDPTMKYVRVGHPAAPWNRDYDPQTDILGVKTEGEGVRKEDFITVLLTGTTALVRTTAYKMYLNGPLYPAEAIHEVFEDSDITHISNEASIWSLCPEPLNTLGRMQFCSNPRSYDFLKFLQPDVIELTGNHLRDYDWKPLKEMLDEFDDRGYLYYGAGRTPEEAAEPVFIDKNSCSFVFLGCNIAGPDHVYVDDKLPGVNKCDFDQMAVEIHEYRDQGLLPIVTLQYYETYSHVPTEMQIADFRRLREAGAVIVSGSQAHYPQTFEPYEDSFIHYGPGNLFFDQDDTPVKGTSKEFLDRYVFYQGRLLQLEVITANLTDYSRPVPMEQEDREALLSEIFSYME